MHVNSYIQQDSRRLTMCYREKYLNSDRSFVQNELVSYVSLALRNVKKTLFIRRSAWRRGSSVATSFASLPWPFVCVEMNTLFRSCRSVFPWSPLSYARETQQAAKAASLQYVT